MKKGCYVGIQLRNLRQLFLFTSLGNQTLPNCKESHLFLFMLASQAEDLFQLLPLFLS